MSRAICAAITKTGTKALTKNKFVEYPADMKFKLCGSISGM